MHPLCSVSVVPRLPRRLCRDAHPQLLSPVRSWGTAEIEVLSEANFPPQARPMMPTHHICPSRARSRGHFSPHPWHLTLGQPSGPGQTRLQMTKAFPIQIPHLPGHQPRHLPEGGTTPTGFQGCLLPWETQLGSGVWHQGKQTDLGETKYACSFFLFKFKGHGNLGGRGGAGDPKEIKAFSLEIKSASRFVGLRAYNAHAM